MKKKPNNVIAIGDTQTPVRPSNILDFSGPSVVDGGPIYPTTGIAPVPLTRDDFERLRKEQIAQQAEWARTEKDANCERFVGQSAQQFLVAWSVGPTAAKVDDELIERAIRAARMLAKKLGM